MPEPYGGGTSAPLPSAHRIFLFAGLAIRLAPKPARVAEASLAH